MADSGVGREQLRAFIERIERLEEEKKAISDDVKEVYAEAKATGFDAKIMRQIIKIRKQDQNERAEQEAILDLYMHALGMIDNGACSGFDDAEPDIREPIRASRHKANPYRNPVGFEVEG